jgi:hypothetical protein
MSSNLWLVVCENKSLYDFGDKTMKYKLFTLIMILISGVSFAGEQLIGEWLINEGSGTTAYCAPQSYVVSDAELNGT